MNSKALKYRMFGTYLAIMAVLLGLSSIATYWLFARSLYGDLDKQLTALAQTAALSLGKKEHPQIDINDRTWEDLEIRGVTLQWFDANGNLLATQGRNGLSLPPVVFDSVQEREQSRELTIAVRNPYG